MECACDLTGFVCWLVDGNVLIQSHVALEWMISKLLIPNLCEHPLGTSHPISEVLCISEEAPFSPVEDAVGVPLGSTSQRRKAGYGPNEVEAPLTI